MTSCAQLEGLQPEKEHGRDAPEIEFREIQGEGETLLNNDKYRLLRQLWRR